MLGSGPGPAPTPSMTLPPLRDLDKALGPESDHSRLANHQPRSQSSDPHLHQHFQQQRSQQQQQQQTSQQAPQQHQYSQKLPPSQHGYQHHDQPSRYPSLGGSLPGTLWIARDGQEEGKDLYMSATRSDSVSSKEHPSHGHNHRHHPTPSSHEPGPGRSDPNNTGHSHHHPQSQQQQNGRPESKSPTSANTTSSTTASSKTSAQASGSTTGMGVTTPGSTDGSSNSGKTTTEQGRNSTKRAAQNRAAQRAFRQRKEEYVRELERKAARLQQAEGQIMFLMARNQELEAKFAQQAGSSGSPLPSPLLPQDSPRGGMVGAAGPMDRGERDRDRDREWAIHERALESNGSFDHYHPSGGRPALGRHSSVQHLRQAYNASSPPLSNSSMKHLSLSSKLSAQESDQEAELQSRPHRHLHRHPSESSLNLHRSGSFPTFTADPKDEDHQVAQRLLSFRGTPVDSRAETTSPTSTNRSPLPGSGNDISMHYYPGSPLTPTHERSSLYSSSSAQNSRATSSAGVGPRSLPSPTSAAHGEGSFPASSSHPPTPYHPSSSGYDLGKKRPSDGTVNWAGQDLYKSPQDSHAPSHHPYHSVKKQASWSSLSEQRRIHAVKKQPSWGSISEYRHSWRNKTESPEMPSDARFGGGSNSSDRGSVTPALPRIPPQFSQRPPQPPTTPQQPPSSFDREYPSPTAAAGPSSSHNNSNNNSAFSPPSSHSQHFHQQQQHHYSPSRSSAAPQHDSHGPSDMDVVHENSNGSNGGQHQHYSHQQQQYQHQHHQEQAGYDSEEMDTYEHRRESSHDQ